MFNMFNIYLNLLFFKTPFGCSEPGLGNIHIDKTARLHKISFLQNYLFFLEAFFFPFLDFNHNFIFLILEALLLSLAFLPPFLTTLLFFPLFVVFFFTIFEYELTFWTR